MNGIKQASESPPANCAALIYLEEEVYSNMQYLLGLLVAKTIGTSPLVHSILGHLPCALYTNVQIIKLRFANFP